MKISKNLPLIIAILIPVTFIGVILFAVYLPSRFTRPSHDFVYTVTQQNEHYILSSDPRPETVPKEILKKYVYYSNTGESKEIEAVNGSILQTQSDIGTGERIAYGYSSYNGDIITDIFGSNSYESEIYLEKGKVRKKLFNLNYDQRFTFVGWVK